MTCVVFLARVSRFGTFEQGWEGSGVKTEISQGKSNMGFVPNLVRLYCRHVSEHEEIEMHSATIVYPIKIYAETICRSFSSNSSTEACTINPADLPKHHQLLPQIEVSAQPVCLKMQQELPTTLDLSSASPNHPS